MQEVHKVYGDSKLNFMFDAEGNNTQKGSLRVARKMQDDVYTWLEAPFPDNNLDGYRELREKVDIPILPVGNTILDLPAITHAIRFQCRDAIRIDTTIAGGITPSRKVMALAEAHGMNVEFQSWGCALSMAANLHLMLAFSNCDFFEMPVPYSEFQHEGLGMIKVDDQGYVNAPEGPGLGMNMDWDFIESISEYTIDTYK